MWQTWVRNTLRRTGFDLIRYNLSASRDARLLHQLQHHRINLILDVGANRGQYAHDLFASGYAGRIVSFEALSAPHAALMAAANKNKRWHIAPQAAIGPERGSVTMHVSGNEVSSSALQVLDLHTTAAPESATVRTETATMLPLDEAAKPYQQPTDRLFLKIDTQGYEAQVLAGATDVLRQAVGVQLELSLVPLYEGQALMPALVAQLNTLGFSLWSITPGFTDPHTGRMLQVDGVFFR